MGESEHNPVVHIVQVFKYHVDQLRGELQAPEGCRLARPVYHQSSVNRTTVYEEQLGERYFPSALI